MKLLIIGGTIFVGRHLVTQALERGFEVTLFNRGKSNPALFNNVEQIHGDRDGGLEALAGRTWDAVIDTCGYFPRLVRASAEALAEATQNYTFISTISVYDYEGLDDLDESSRLHTLADPTIEKLDSGEAYGGLKVLCEQACREVYGDRALIIRSGLIVGPHDPTHRFTYWPVRLHEGGEVLAPGPRDADTQFIDARDLAQWTLDAIAEGVHGTFNATGPGARLTLGEVVDACAVHAPDGTRVTWVDGSFLQEREVAPYSELPLWLPPEALSISRISVARAVAEGLRFRPLAETIADTLAWASSFEDLADRPGKAGLAAEREVELLSAWKAHSGAE